MGATCTSLLGLLLKVGDQVVTFLLLLKTSEGHLGARNVLFGVLQVFEEGLFTPSDTLGNVGRGVREPFGLASLSSENTVEVGADFVSLTGLKSMALSTAGLEKGSTLGSVTWLGRHWEEGMGWSSEALSWLQPPRCFRTKDWPGRRVLLHLCQRFQGYHLE